MEASSGPGIKFSLAGSLQPVQAKTAKYEEIQVSLVVNGHVFTNLEAMKTPPDPSIGTLMQKSFSSLTNIFTKSDKADIKLQTWVPIKLDNDQVVYIKIEELFQKTFLGDRAMMEKQLKPLIDRPPEDRIGLRADAGKIIEGKINLLEPKDRPVERQAAIVTQFLTLMLEEQGTLAVSRPQLHVLMDRPLSSDVKHHLQIKKGLQPLNWQAIEGNRHLDTALTTTSTTATKRPKEMAIALANWKEADRMVRSWAIQGRSLTAADIKEINRTLAKGLKNNGGIPGEYRSNGENIRPGLGAQYVLGAHVQEEMDGFSHWCEEQLKACDRQEINPVELASQVAQRLISIHPFSDANGRTMMLVMNFVLQRSGLPPAAVEDGNFAVFGMAESSPNNLSRDINEVAQEVRKGILKTCTILGIQTPFEH